MYRFLRRYLVLLLVLAAISGCASASSQSASTHPTPTRISAVQGQSLSVDAVVQEVLQNIQTNGFNSNPAINNGLGGLWINWRYGTNPLQTNMQGNGTPDSPSLPQPRHDRLTDLRYIHTLWMYKTQHPSDHQFDNDITRYTAIVRADFASATDQRGWVYDEFIDLYRLSHDEFYHQAADSEAHYFAERLYKPALGTMYFTNTQYPAGYYRVDLMLEDGCALVEAGTTEGNAQWVAEGKSTIQFVFAHAYLPQYHVLLFQMSDVVRPDGTANPSESIFKGTYGHETIRGGQVKLGETAQEALALLHVYTIAHDPTYLSKATDLLDPLTADNNSFHLWDDQQLGYYGGIAFPGSSASDPGVPQLITKSKESGRQLQMLETFHVANTLTGNRYQKMEQLMLQVTVQKAFYAPGHGFLYEETADWQPPLLKNGQQADWVTTEAMGVALEGLLSLQAATAW